MTGLTTHVLDTVRGAGAAGMEVELHAPDGVITTTTLDENGRATLLSKTKPGAYKLLFHAGAYLKSTDFYDIIPVHFLVTNAGHYHVHLILSPFGYSTYRGT